MSLIYGFVGLVLGAAILLCVNLQILHLLDEYIVGNLILLTVAVELLGFVIFYGCKRILADFEFILGNKVSKCWVVFWWLTPFLLIAFLIWRLCMENLVDGIVDEVWVYAVGWGVVLTALVFIFAMGFYNVYHQDEYYTFIDVSNNHIIATDCASC